MKHALFSFYIAGALSTGAGMTLHVSPGGADTNPGTEDRPFATLVRARDEIRTLKKDGRLPNDGVTVLLAPGRYALAEPLELTAEDSGADSAPVVYRAWEHGTVVKFDAGVTPMLLIEPRISRPELKPRYIMEELAGRPFAADGIADPQEWPKTNKVPLECVNKISGLPRNSWRAPASDSTASACASSLRSMSIRKSR